MVSFVMNLLLTMPINQEKGQKVICQSRFFLIFFIFLVVLMGSVVKP